MGRTDKATKLWFPIQKMMWDYHDGEYSNCRIVYVNGAEKLEQLYPEQPNMVSFGSLQRVITFDNLDRCPWSNRMPVNQEPSSDIAKILNFTSSSELDPIEYVAIDGGYRHGDMRNLFPEVEVDSNGKYNFLFRSVDSYTFASPNRSELNFIQSCGRVSPLFELERLKLVCGGYTLGYAPPHIRELYNKYRDSLNIEIYQVNSQASSTYQFLLKAVLDSQIGIPFSQPEYQPIA